MPENCTVPLPVLFNCLKHHLGFINDYIHTSVASGNIVALSSQLLLIGESQMDLYLGELTPASIANQIIQYLQEKDAFEKEEYVNFINIHESGYRTFTISDASVWVLRLGELEGRHIHIHPGRYSPHTIRIKAGSLKTAIALSVWMKLHNHKEITLELVNRVRKEVLGASPVKSVVLAEGFGKVFRLIHSEK